MAELDSKIRIKKERLEEVREVLALRANSYLERVQTSPTPDGIVNAVIELLKMEKEIEDCEIELLKKKEKIVTEIFRIRNRVYLDILNYRYIKYMDFEYIETALNYSQRHMSRLHSNALVVFYDVVLREREREREEENKKDG